MGIFLTLLTRGSTVLIVFSTDGPTKGEVQERLGGAEIHDLVNVA